MGEECKGEAEAKFETGGIEWNDIQVQLEMVGYVHLNIIIPGKSEGEALSGLPKEKCA